MHKKIVIPKEKEGAKPVQIHLYKIENDCISHIWLQPCVCTRELCVFAFQTLGVMADAAEAIATDTDVSKHADLITTHTHTHTHDIDWLWITWT